MTELAKQDRHQHPTASALRDFLAEEGYRPHLEAAEDGAPRLLFKCEGTNYLVRFDANDPEFVQLCTGYNLAEGLRDELALLRAGNEVQAATKIVKVYVGPGLEVVEFQLELLLTGAPTTSLLERCLGTLRAATSDYFERVRPELPVARA